jgi:hypothetical protein
LKAELANSMPTAAASIRIQQMLRLAENESAAIREQADTVLAESRVRAEQIPA